VKSVTNSNHYITPRYACQISLARTVPRQSEDAPAQRMLGKQAHVDPTSKLHYTPPASVCRNCIDLEEMEWQ